MFCDTCSRIIIHTGIRSKLINTRYISGLIYRLLIDFNLKHISHGIVWRSRFSVTTRLLCKCFFWWSVQQFEMPLKTLLIGIFPSCKAATAPFTWLNYWNLAAKRRHDLTTVLAIFTPKYPTILAWLHDFMTILTVSKQAKRANSLYIYELTYIYTFFVPNRRHMSCSIHKRFWKRALTIVLNCRYGSINLPVSFSLLLLLLSFMFLCDSFNVYYTRRWHIINFLCFFFDVGLCAAVFCT